MKTRRWILGGAAVAAVGVIGTTTGLLVPDARLPFKLTVDFEKLDGSIVSASTIGNLVFEDTAWASGFDAVSDWLVGHVGSAIYIRDESGAYIFVTTQPDIRNQSRRFRCMTSYDCARKSNSIKNIVMVYLVHRDIPKHFEGIELVREIARSGVSAEIPVASLPEILVVPNLQDITTAYTVDPEKPFLAFRRVASAYVEVLHSGNPQPLPAEVWPVFNRRTDEAMTMLGSTMPNFNTSFLQENMKHG